MTPWLTALFPVLCLVVGAEIVAGTLEAMWSRTAFNDFGALRAQEQMRTIREIFDRLLERLADADRSDVSQWEADFEYQQQLNDTPHQMIMEGGVDEQGQGQGQGQSEAGIGSFGGRRTWRRFLRLKQLLDILNVDRVTDVYRLDAGGARLVARSEVQQWLSQRRELTAETVASVVPERVPCCF